MRFPRVITEALADPDVLATFLALVVAAVVIAWAIGPRSTRPRWLVGLALLSVAAIVATTVVPSGGWRYLVTGYGQPLADCFGVDQWLSLGAYSIEADTLLNVVLYIPAGFLWVTLVRRPVRVVLALALLSVAIESWQTPWRGDRTTTSVATGCHRRAGYGRGAGRVRPRRSRDYLGSGRLITMGWVAPRARGRRARVWLPSRWRCRRGPSCPTG